MGHERLKHIKDNLMTCIEGQMYNLQEVDAEELGEAIDMLKDLEEALYYCTITEAMEGKGDSEFKLGRESQHSQEHTQYYGGGRSYYPMNDWMPPIQYNNGGSPSSSSGSSSMSSNSQSYSNGGRARNSNGEFMSNYSEPLRRDGREGRSPEMRRMYMEAREHNVDKAAQMRELEHYMQELSSDVVEMIQEATTEEKQYLEKRLLALASKIGQMK